MHCLLASQSLVRRRILADSGIDIAHESADIDEDYWRQRKKKDGVKATVLALAQAKAKVISAKYPTTWVIGCDQILSLPLDDKSGDEIWLNKPLDYNQAFDQLCLLRGRKHHLVTGVSVVKEKEVVWDYCDQATITMRNYSDDYIHHHLSIGGQDVLVSPAACQVEGLGVQLIEHIDGDFFTILGLPLLPLLAFLRQIGLVKT